MTSVIFSNLWNTRYKHNPCLPRCYNHSQDGAAFFDSSNDIYDISERNSFAFYIKSVSFHEYLRLLCLESPVAPTRGFPSLSTQVC